jgi:hypothetical protein
MQTKGDTFSKEVSPRKQKEQPVDKKRNLGYSRSCRSRGSSVNLVTAYGLDDRDSIPDRGRGFFF